MNAYNVLVAKELLPHEPLKRELYVLSSRFIGLLFPLDDIEDVGSFLKTAKDSYPKASHYPYAARCEGKEKASEDGEPPRSSAFPLLELLRKRSIDHAMIVVVRYFGGTKLGLPRLTRTYRKVGEMLLDDAEYSYFVEVRKLHLSLDYPSFSHIKAKADEMGLLIKEVEYGVKVSLTILGDDRIISSVLDCYPNAKIISSNIDRIRRKLLI